MASGTGLTSGPYNLAAGGLLTLADPNAKGGQVSDRVQIQNLSGFTLTVYSSGAPYTIPALQSSTIPTAAGGQSITVISSATSSTGAGSVGGSVSAVWLVPEQSSPIPDGPLTVGAAVGSVAVGSKIHAFSIIFPGPYSENWPIDYTVQRLSLTVQISGLASGTITLQIQGNNSSQVYYLRTFSANGYYTATFAVFGSIDLSIQVTTTYGGLASPTVSYSLTATESSSTSADTVTYGGAQNIAVTGIAPGISSTLLGGPGSGLAYRLHSWSVNKAITVAADYLTLAASSSGTVFDIAVPSSPGKYLGGLILADGVVFKNASSTITFGVFLSYDLIISPLIS